MLLDGLVTFAIATRKRIRAQSREKKCCAVDTDIAVTVVSAFAMMDLKVLECLFHMIIYICVCATRMHLISTHFCFVFALRPLIFRRTLCYGPEPTTNCA